MAPNDFYRQLGKKLRARRQAKHIALNELAKALNKSVATVSKYESGDICIGIDVLVDICTFLDIDIASLLPETSSGKTKNELFRYQNSVFERLYIYWYNGEKNRLQKAVLENQNKSLTSVMYYDVKSVNDYHTAPFIYEGQITCRDTDTAYIFFCTETPFDMLTIRLSSLNRNGTSKVGLLTTISYFYQDIAMKVIASEIPLAENEGLISSLRISKEELKNIKRTNFFMIW